MPAEMGKVAISPQALRVSMTMLDDTPIKTAIKCGLDQRMCIASGENADSILDLQFIGDETEDAFRRDHVFMAHLCCPFDSEQTVVSLTRKITFGKPVAKPGNNGDTS